MKPIKIDNLRPLAQGKECKVNVPNVCNYNPETTVLAHLNGGGMARKQYDLLGAHACSDCHDYIDGRRKLDITLEELGLTESQAVRLLLHYEGIIRTQNSYFKCGTFTQTQKKRKKMA